MSQRKELQGKRFGRLVVTEWESGAWRCQCDCGGSKLASSNHLERGQIRSCGCLRPKHGGKGTRTYAIWRGIIDRCTREKHRNWADYGGRGITVCERWRSFPNFLADMGEAPSWGTVDRRDNSGNYEPGNCFWAGRKAQARNTRRNIVIIYDGRSQSLSAWAEEFEANYWLLHSRYRLGWSPERMFEDLLR